MDPKMQAMADTVIASMKLYVDQHVKATAFDSDKFGEGMGELMREMVAPLKARIEALEAVPFSYAGTYEQSRMYTKNQTVTYDGSLWIALRTTQQAPGPGDGWQLCVKRGKDGRDSR